MSTQFEGFTESALDFLQELRQNNNRDWFLPHKSIYETQLKAPMVTLIGVVTSACRKKDLFLVPKEKSSVSRIYRDVRFSPDKRPFQHHIGGTLQGRVGTVTLGELYIHVSAEQSFVATGFYMPDPVLLRMARNRMAEKPDEFASVVRALAKKTLELSKEWQLKRMPRGYEPYAQSPVAEYIRMNSLVVSHKLDRSEVTSSDLAKTIVSFAVASRPLLDYGWGLGYRPNRIRESDLG